MKNYYSISKFPGKQGEYFYNGFFKLHGIDAVYTPIGVDESQFAERYKELAKSACGISVSMPYKQTVINMLDYRSLDVATYNSCNTVYIDNNRSNGYNTDLASIIHIMSKIKYDERIIILGNGSIGKMFYQYANRLGYNKINLLGRSLGNWEHRHNSCDVLINCTALGTVNTDSPVDNLHKDTRLVVDLSVRPGKLAEQSRGIDYFSGQEFYKYQFIKQYAIYTGRIIEWDEYDFVARKR